MLLQFEGVGKEKALEVLGALAAVVGRVEVLGVHAGLHVAAAQAFLLGDFGGLGAAVALGDRHRDRLQDHRGRRRGAFVEVLVGECGNRGDAEQIASQRPIADAERGVRFERGAPRGLWSATALVRLGGSAGGGGAGVAAAAEVERPRSGAGAAAFAPCLLLTLGAALFALAPPLLAVRQRR